MNQRIIYALGFFDGVHLGHQALLTACRELADKHGCAAGALTFADAPLTVLKGQKANNITTLHDRTRLLHAYGMENVKIFPTNRETLSISWQDFLHSLIQEGAAGFVCGNDFRFGRGGEGNATGLQAFCKENGLPCAVVEEQTMDGARISSTRIRALLEAGDVAQANRLLGHPYVLTGQVVAGRQLGRTIQFPTANLTLGENMLCPRFGVYACKALLPDGTYKAVTNIGTRPTVSGEGITVEAHLLDFDGDLYGKELTLHVYDFLRPEQKFTSVEELQKQIAEDIKTADSM